MTCLIFLIIIFKKFLIFKYSYFFMSFKQVCFTKKKKLFFNNVILFIIFVINVLLSFLNFEIKIVNLTQFFFIFLLSFQSLSLLLHFSIYYLKILILLILMNFFLKFRTSFKRFLFRDELIRCHFLSFFLIFFIILK